jgi:large conductance mechanosensitive channel
LGQSKEARKEGTMLKERKLLKEMARDFKTFIMRGNVTDMAVGIIIGAAFGTIVSSMVKDVIMPPIGLVLGKIDFSNLAVVLKQGTPHSPYATLAAAQAAGAVTLNYGQFINTVINFLIIALVVFFFIVRPIAKMREPKKAVEPAAPTTKECPFCYINIPIKATRCPNCTSELKSA